MNGGGDGLQRQYLRDNDGKFIRIMRPEERWTKYEYDGTGNIMVTKHSDGNRKCFTYNPDELLIEAANENSTVKFHQDTTGRIIQEIRNGYNIKSKYDTYGKNRSLSWKC